MYLAHHELESVIIIVITFIIISKKDMARGFTATAHATGS